MGEFQAPEAGFDALPHPMTNLKKSPELVLQGEHFRLVRTYPLAYLEAHPDGRKTPIYNDHLELELRDGSDAMDQPLWKGAYSDMPLGPKAYAELLTALAEMASR